MRSNNSNLSNEEITNLLLNQNNEDLDFNFGEENNDDMDGLLSPNYSQASDTPDTTENEELNEEEYN